jgi:hypothetical protein
MNKQLMFDQTERRRGRIESDSELTYEDASASFADFDSFASPLENGLPAIPDAVYDLLPGFLDRLTDVTDDRVDRDVILIGALGVLSGAARGVKGFYSQQEALNLYVCLVAPAGTGKGKLSQARRLGKYIDHRLTSESMKALKAHAPQLEHGDPPPFRQFFLAGDTSAAALKESLRDNPNGVIFETEIETLNAVLGQKWGAFRDVLLKSYHGETVKVARKGERPLIIDEPRLSLVLSGTPSSFFGLIDDPGDGLFSRLSFYAFEKEAAFSNQFFDRRSKSLDRLMKEGAEKLDRMHGVLDERSRPLYVTWSLPHKKRLYRVGARAMDRFSEDNLDGAMQSVIKRQMLVAYRIAGLLTLLRRKEDQLKTQQAIEVTEDDVSAGLLIGLTFLDHGAHMMRHLATRRNSKHRSLNHRQRSILAALPNTFKGPEAVEIVKKLGSSERTAYRDLNRLSEAGLIKELEYSSWRKTTEEAEYRSFLPCYVPPAGGGKPVNPGNAGNPSGDDQISDEQAESASPENATPDA